MREDLSQHEAVSPCLTAWLHRVPAIEKDSQFVQCQLNVQAQLHGLRFDILQAMDMVR